jgi:hypothetical protein
MLNAGGLTFQEFVMQEQVPLATIHAAVLEFLRDRNDVVIFGAQAVNAWVGEPRIGKPWHSRIFNPLMKMKTFKITLQPSNKADSAFR